MFVEGVDHHNYERPGEREGIVDGEEYIKGYGVTGTPPTLTSTDGWPPAQGRYLGRDFSSQ